MLSCSSLENSTASPASTVLSPTSLQTTHSPPAFPSFGGCCFGILQFRHATSVLVSSYTSLHYSAAKMATYSYEATLDGLDWVSTEDSHTSQSSSLRNHADVCRLKKPSLGIFGSVSRRLRGIRSTSPPKLADTPGSTSSSQRPLPPFSLRHFSSLKKRQEVSSSRDVSRKAATVRAHGTERTAHVPQERRCTSIGDVVDYPASTKGDVCPISGLGKPSGTQAPQLDIPKGIGGDFMLYDGA